MGEAAGTKILPFRYSEHRSTNCVLRRFKHRMFGTVNFTSRIAPMAHKLAALLVFLLVFLLVPAASAQTPAKNDEVFRYRGADRDARLIERAKQEGTLTLYTSLAPSESK